MSNEKIIYLTREEVREAANQKLRFAKIGYIVLSLLICILGVTLMVVPDFSVRLRTDAMVHILCVLLGLATLADALLKVQISIDAKRFGISKWWMILAAAIFTGVVGALLLFRPNAGAEVIMTLLGLSFLGEGILNLVTVLCAVQILKKKYPVYPNM